MSTLYFNKEALQNPKTPQDLIMLDQYKALHNRRLEGMDRHNAIVERINNGRAMQGNAGLTPGDAFRMMDPTTKDFQAPAGEFTTLKMLLSQSKATNLGQKLYTYRKFNELDEGQISLSGTTGVKGDKGDYTYANGIIPIFDKGFGIDWRDKLALDAENFNALVDYSREAERGIHKTMNSFLWNGDSSVNFKGTAWGGIKNDSTVATATLTVDLTSSSATPVEISNEVARVADILWITNNCPNKYKFAVSREIMSHWERTVYSTATGAWGTLLDYIKSFRYFDEIYEDPELSGNQIAMYWLDNTQGFHALTGMAMSTYALPRTMHNSGFDYIKWAACGFLARTDSSDQKCALYATE